ncbi:MAG: T9SS type A sorting domain-containing protein [Opitutaceae bacterium]|nr:T9SS type A sorting domain-containing protein [Cytophagales bacterium]
MSLSDHRLKCNRWEEGNGQDSHLAGINLNSGSYILSVQDEKGKHVQKIVKQ